MIDLRQHIYSLAAVFLALAIGIVIGTSFAKTMPSDSSGRRTIQRYERVMRDLRGEIIKSANKSTQEEAALKSREEYCKAVMPLAISGRLRWRNVAIIQTGTNDELTGSVKQALEAAGAQITCTADISNKFAFDDGPAIAASLSTMGIGSANDDAQDRAKLFRVLANTIATGKSAYLVPKIEKAGVAAFTGALDKPCKLVVLVGGASSDADNRAEIVDSQLLACFERAGIRAVGCEPSTTDVSYVPVWHKAGIATVDNADSALGQTCLVYALKGETASFGSKKTADRLIPRTMESQ